MDLIQKYRWMIGLEGFTLIEVLASLVLLSLLSVVLLGNFTASGIWIADAGKKTSARDYASSIIEMIRMHSSELSLLQLTDESAYEVIDDDTEDEMFAFVLGSEEDEINVSAPEHLEATLLIKRYDGSSYYDQEITAAFDHNLYEVDVKVRGSDEGELITEMVTVVAAR
ncbi:MAG: prepilin-type N-terminal cleavage/methylation domain-containing protein [Bacillota bacterium]|nr:prepilin-type N-terminal cleavage/methylation domain-containing protein [Bacillota bacterium]